MSEKEVSKESNKESNGEKKNQNSSKSKEALEDPFYNPEVLTKVNVNINSSSSKQMYTIPKAERFKYSKVGVDSIYNLPSVMEKRSAGLGYGQKNDFTKGGMRGKTDSIYNIPREFDLKRRNTPQYSFGKGRDVCKKPEFNVVKATPGVGTYNIGKNLGDDALKFSIFGREWVHRKI